MPFYTFCAIVLSAATTLMGLLFVAVQFNVDRRGHKLGSAWLSLARSTINIYVVLFLIPLVLLLPDLQDRTRAGLILTLATFSIVRQFVCWAPAWRIGAESSRHILFRLAWLLLAPVCAFGTVVHSAATFLWWQSPVQHQSLSLALLGLFIVALRNSWNLVLQHTEVMCQELSKTASDQAALARTAG